MSIIRKLSDVLKEVFWIKPSSGKKKASIRRKVTVKKKSGKKPAKIKKKPILKPAKTPKPLKVAKPLKPKNTKTPLLDPHWVRVGEVTHYFDRIKVCVVKITHGTILIGDKLTFVGKNLKFVQKVWSMQIESQDVKVAKKGQLIGLKVDKPCQVGDIVYK